MGIKRHLLCEASKGFTLIELMIVVVISAILAAMSLVYLGRYKERAQAKDLVTMARGCAVEVLARCVDESGGVSGMSADNFSACANRTLDNTGQVSITVTGCCTGFTVEATGEKVDLYKGRCTGDYREKLDCDIVGR